MVIPTKAPLRKVCVVSPHPLVLDQLAARVGSQPRLAVLKLELPSLTKAAQVGLPEAAAYVVDGNAAAPVIHGLLTEITTQFSAARIVFITTALDERTCFPVLRMGVRGLLTYEDAQENLPRALEMVSSGGYWVPRALLSRFVESILRANPRLQKPPGALDLSPREQQVLECLLENLSNKEIANRLCISERTAKFHVSNLLAKFGARRRADLILACHQRGPS